MMMNKERVFKIADANGVEYGVLFVHTFDVGAHQMSCVILKLCSNLPEGYQASGVFWENFEKTLMDFLENNPEDVIYFCHRDIPRNLARLRIYEFKFRQYALAHGLRAEFFVCRGNDSEGGSRHIMFGMNKSNSEFDALKSAIENNAEHLVLAHEEIQNDEHGVLNIN